MGDKQDRVDPARVIVDSLQRDYNARKDKHPKPGLYRHYKGDYYVVVAVAQDSDNDDKGNDVSVRVVYWRLSDRKWFFRSLDQWWWPVDGYDTVPRYHLIEAFETPEPSQVSRLTFR